MIGISKHAGKVRTYVCWSDKEQPEIETRTNVNPWHLICKQGSADYVPLMKETLGWLFILNSTTTGICSKMIFQTQDPGYGNTGYGVFKRVIQN